MKTPFLLDDGAVSRAYDTLGHGMHAGLPGHGFVLVDSNGIHQWKGEYPSMWLAPNELSTRSPNTCPHDRYGPPGPCDEGGSTATRDRRGM